MAGFNNLINTPVPFTVPNGGTGAQTFTANGILLGNGTGAVSASSALTNGQLLIGDTSSAPVAATLTAGTGISISNGAGSITITNTAAAGGLATVNQTTASVTMAINTQFINTSSGNAQVTYTLPSTAAQGSIFRIVGVTGNTGGWVLQCASGQTAWVGNVACSAAGTWTSGAATDVISFICTVANTVFVAFDGATQDLAYT